VLKSFSNAWVHSGTTGENKRVVEIFSDINVALHDGVESNFMDSLDVSVDGFFGVEQSFWASELLVADGDDVSVWEFELDVFVGGLSELFQFIFVI